MKYKGIIFDFNGVLLWDDAWHDESWIKVSGQLRGTPMSVEEMRQKIHGGNNRNAFSQVLGRPVSDEELPSLTDKKESLYRDIASGQPGFHLSPGAATLLDMLAEKNIPRAIATSSEITNLNFYIEKLGLEKWFDRGLIVYDDGSMPSKPAPDIYLRAAAKLGLDPKDCIVIEDSRFGVEAAHRAGIGKIIHLTHGHSDSWIGSAPVAKIINTLGEITLEDFEK